MRLPSHDRPSPPLPAALDRCPRLVGREFAGTHGRSAASFRQAAIPLHQNGGCHLRPHRPQRSPHWISRAWCGRLRRYRAGDGPQHGHRPAAAQAVGPQWCNFWVGHCGRCGRSRPDVFWRGGGWYGVGARPSRRPLAVSTRPRHFRAHAGDAGAEQGLVARA